MQGFRTAALSVTNLYKDAVAGQARARHLGYQEALEDLRAFIDAERLGSTDREAGKIRSWVLERCDRPMESDDDKARGTNETEHCDEEDHEGVDLTRDEHKIEEKHMDTSNPLNEEESRTTQPHAATATSTSPSDQAAPTEIDPSDAPVFSFTANPQLPQNYASTTTGTDIDMQPPSPHATIEFAPGDPSNTIAPSKHDMMPRHTHTRTHVRQNGGLSSHRCPASRTSTSSSANNTSSATAAATVAAAAAATPTKRKYQHFGEFFDISGLTYGAPPVSKTTCSGCGNNVYPGGNCGGNGGGKRGRFM